MIKRLLIPFGFSFGQLQDIATLLRHLERNNVSVGDYLEYIEQIKIEQAKNKKFNKERFTKLKELWNKNALKCPECSTVMNLYPVNTNPRDQVEGNFSSQWLCPKCQYEWFSNRNIKSWMKEINENSSIKWMNTR